MPSAPHKRVNLKRHPIQMTYCCSKVRCWCVPKGCGKTALLMHHLGWKLHVRNNFKQISSQANWCSSNLFHRVNYQLKSFTTEHITIRVKVLQIVDSLPASKLFSRQYAYRFVQCLTWSLKLLQTNLHFICICLSKINFCSSNVWGIIIPKCYYAQSKSFEWWAIVVMVLVI